MSVDVLDIKCRGCGAALAIGDNECKYCGGPVNVSTFNSVAGMSLPLLNNYANSYSQDMRANPMDSNASKSAAYCYLKLKMYDNAVKCFEKAIATNFDDSEIYFYAAICCLGGKKAFLCQRPTIDKIQEYLNAAISIEPKGIYYYFLAYIKYDYFKRKYLNVTPNFEATLKMAVNCGVSEFDVKQLFELLGVDNPFVK